MVGDAVTRSLDIIIFGRDFPAPGMERDSRRNEEKRVTHFSRRDKASSTWGGGTRVILMDSDSAVIGSIAGSLSSGNERITPRLIFDIYIRSLLNKIFYRREGNRESVASPVKFLVAPATGIEESSPLSKPPHVSLNLDLCYSPQQP